eukprot:CAMPEP_0197030966 /NCGR_PEP_ID=MMETSP1384-20130603/10086_1 /TAXON_ID=29189 /ORGANISM="Ammonia sp." /LENGTH=489 /DNA_ID=CAMNT_0042460409 /DNA_START=46 /DNA_END=1515 /DNA_ORIENTATION=+
MSTTSKIRLQIHSNTPSTDASLSPHTPYHVESPDFCPSIYPTAEEDKAQHMQIHLDSETAAKPMPNVHLFENQVAGTLPMFHSNGVIYKPLKTDLERTFYKNIAQWLPAIEPFIPQYSGIEYLAIDTIEHAHRHEHEHENENDSHHEHVAQVNNAWSQQMFRKNKHRITKTPFLILEDVTKSYRKPCILDLKIGTRHFPPICKMDKMHRKLRKAWCSTCKDFGARIGGVQMYDPLTNKYRIVSKHTAMQFDKNQFVQQIQDFFTNSCRDGQSMHILTAFIAKLSKLMEILKAEHRFRWFSCSLLFVYEGCNAAQPQPDKAQPAENEHKEDEQEGQELHDTNRARPAPAKGIRNDLRLIDFTNFVIVEKYLDEIEKLQHSTDQNSGDEQDDSVDEEQEEVIADDKHDDDDDDDEVLQLKKELDNLDEPDHGMLFGLDGIIKLLSELEKTQCIKIRNDLEWTTFTSNLLHSKMALIPFSNKDDFNEQTTIH